MNTMDVFVVIRDMGYDGEQLVGIYQRKEDAEFISDHLEAMTYDFIRDVWIKYEYRDKISLEGFIRSYSHDSFRVEEEEVYL